MRDDWLSEVCQIERLCVPSLWNRNLSVYPPSDAELPHDFEDRFTAGELHSLAGVIS